MVMNFNSITANRFAVLEAEQWAKLPLDTIIQPCLEPNPARNMHPAILLDGAEQERTTKVDEMTYRYGEIMNVPAPVTVILVSPYANSEIRYTLNGKNPNPSSRLYERPLTFKQNVTGSDRAVVKARIYDKTNANVKSRIIRLEFRVLR